MTSGNSSKRKIEVLRLDNLWVEKYRPKKLDDLCINPITKKLILSWGDEIPHILLIGSAGIGKTTMAKILVQDILDCDYLYINASDENGIETIRGKITSFIQTKSIDGKLKVVICDEADYLTQNAQAALRNMIEEYSNSARFILTGNHKHKIKDAIRSRCQSIDINPSIGQAANRCIDILKLEGISIAKDQRDPLINMIKRLFPDIRKCIGDIQKHCINGHLDITESNHTSSVLITNILSDIRGGRCLSTRKYLIENESLFNGDWNQLFVDLLNEIYESDIEDVVKAEMIIIIGEHLDRSTRVSDFEINFFCCLLRLQSVK